MRQPKREGSACKDHQPERPDQRVCVDGVGRVSRNHLPRQLTQGRPCWCPARLPGAPSLKSWSVQISHIDMLCGECQWLGQVADLPERLGHDVANVFEQSFNIHDFEVEPSSQAKNGTLLLAPCPGLRGFGATCANADAFSLYVPVLLPHTQKLKPPHWLRA